jgi:hypothetical protein
MSPSTRRFSFTCILCFGDTECEVDSYGIFTTMKALPHFVHDLHNRFLVSSSPNFLLDEMEIVQKAQAAVTSNHGSCAVSESCGAAR